MAMPTRNSQGHVEQTVTQLSWRGVVDWLAALNPDEISKPCLPRHIFLIHESKVLPLQGPMEKEY